MRKTLSLVLALAMLLTMCASFATAEEMTEQGTPRAQTLIVEFQSPITTPGQFNPYMNGTSKGSGLHQMLFDYLWEMDTVKGEQFPALAEDFPESNEDFTEHTFHIRQGMTWSDGEAIDANDVVYTINAVMANSNIGCSAYWNTVFASVEAVDDYTVKVTTKESFPRLSEKFGVTIWGSDLTVVPEHIFSQMEDISTDTYSNPVSATQYQLKDFDQVGYWILFEKREDYQNTAQYMLEGECVPQYVLFRSLGADETRMMEMVSNKVDILCEVTPELLESMTEMNDKIRCWYEGWPYATMDDPCSKGISFSIGAGEPYSNKYFRWGLALALDMTEVADNIFDGIGRSSVMIATATTAGQNNYYAEMLDWLKEFTIEGTDIQPFDDTYAQKMYEKYSDKFETEPTEEELIAMFGYGTWKYDPEAATTLLEMAGLEKKDDGWYFNGEPFFFSVNTIADTEAQAVRGGEAAVDQWKKFGLNCEVQSLISTAFSDAESTGEFQLGAYWPTGYILDDMYSQWSGWDADLIVPTGERSNGNGERWSNQEFTDKLHDLAKMSHVQDPQGVHDLCVEMLKLTVEDMVFIGFHSGTKFVPTNSTYWTNYPTAENDYDGPWWWWSTFTYILPNFESTAA
ncbi:MAG: ABC transporter substrate-binding protein [Clostridia bacterium]|nr:ABC transporter substrate-binding protein [Clostridia bacterium]